MSKTIISDRTPMPTVVRKMDGQGDFLGLYFVLGACQYPTYIIRGVNGDQDYWCQHLTKPASEAEVAEYWQARALRLEQENRLLKDELGKVRE